MRLGGGLTVLTPLRAGVVAEGVAEGACRSTVDHPPTAGLASVSVAGVGASRGEKIPDIPVERGGGGERGGGEGGGGGREREVGLAIYLITRGMHGSVCMYTPSGGCVAGVEAINVDITGYPLQTNRW